MRASGVRSCGKCAEEGHSGAKKNYRERESPREITRVDCGVRDAIPRGAPEVGAKSV